MFFSYIWYQYWFIIIHFTCLENKYFIAHGCLDSVLSNNSIFVIELPLIIEKIRANMSSVLRLKFI